MTVGWRLLRFLLLLAVSVIVFFTLFQRKMLYYPHRHSVAEAAEAAEMLGLEPWVSDGRTHGWMRAAPGATVNAVVFHGNAGSALDRYYYVEGLGHGHWQVHLFEYPGYGSRSGKPSQQAFVEAALDAVQDLEKQGLPVILVGESIGSGVAAEVASALPSVNGLLFVTPFHDLASVAKVHFPFLPVGWMLRDRFESAKALEGYRGPLAVLLAGKDRVVPTAEGRRLYDAFQGPKNLWIQENADHNDLDVSPSSSWWGEARRFLESGLKK